MPKAQIITGVDIGTSSIKTLVVQKKEGEKTLEFLKAVKSYSFGLRKGVVVDVTEVAKNIRNSLFAAQGNLAKKINSVYININGPYIHSTPSQGLISVSRADRKISPEDMERVLKATQAINLPSNYEILDVFPQEFIVDNQGGIREPVGLKGVRLEAKVLLFCVFSPYLKNLTQSVLEAGVQIEDIIASPLAAARAVLSEKEKELGVALVNIGAATTGLAVFKEGNLIHLAIFPVGSANITNDIAIGLQTKIDMAEEIKKQFGSCLTEKEKKSKNRKKIKISEDSEKKNLLSFSQKLLTRIIEARVREIFELVSKELKKIPRELSLPAGAVLTGGGVKLKKIVELAKKELKLPCRIGIPQEIVGIEPDTTLSTVAGLVLAGADSEGEEAPSSGIKSKIKRFFRIFIP